MKINQKLIATEIHKLAKQIETRRERCIGIECKMGFNEYSDEIGVLKSEPNGERWITFRLARARKRSTAKEGK